MILLLPPLAIAGLIAYYYLMFKPKQDEKKEQKNQSKKNTVPTEPDPYQEIVDEYPTYFTQKTK